MSRAPLMSELRTRALLAVAQLCAFYEGRAVPICTTDVLHELDTEYGRSRFEHDVLYRLAEFRHVARAEWGGGGWLVTASGLQHLASGGIEVLPVKPVSVRRLERSSYVGERAKPRNTAPMLGTYDKDECNFKHVRPGSMDFRQWPSRRGDLLHYFDGRVEQIQHGTPQVERPKRRLRQWDLEQIAAPEADRRAA